MEMLEGADVEVLEDIEIIDENPEIFDEDYVDNVMDSVTTETLEFEEELDNNVAEASEIVEMPDIDYNQVYAEIEEEPVSYTHLLPDSSIRYLTNKDLEGFTAEMCRLARNELFARHGRKFKDEMLQEYFNACSWYEGTVEPDEFDDDVFNSYEVANRDLIIQYEMDRGYR